jgi:hypothetical protein
VLGIVEERAKSLVGRPLDEDHHRTWRDVRFAFLNPIQPAERHYASAVLADRPRLPTGILPVRFVVRQVEEVECVERYGDPPGVSGCPERLTGQP